MHSKETRFDELKRYVGWTDDDATCLASFRPLAESEFPRIARSFYDRIREHEEAHAVFTGEDQIERLQRSLVRWMHRLLSGRYDEGYFAETSHIGRVHVKVGLPQRYMFTAMALIRIELTRIAERELGARAFSTRDALTRLLDLDLAIMLEAYREDFVARVQRIERQQMQALGLTLARTEHRYVNAVELARVVVIGLGTEGDIRLFNREAERVTGYERDEVLGTPFITTLLQEDIADAHGALIRAAWNGNATNREFLETAVRTKSGNYRDVRLQLAYAPSAEPGDDVVLFVIGQDVTEAKAAIARSQQAEKLAAVGTLAAGLAHEIRNPLNGAQLHVAFLERSLKRTNADNDVMEAVHVVGDEIKRLATLVTEFLDFARPRPPSLRSMSLLALCERAMQIVGGDAAKANVRVEADMPSRDVQISGDPAKLEQVLLNLVHNAIEAMASGGGGKVVLRVRRQPRHATLEVEDTGPGIPSADAPIFDAFFSTKPSGTGLGLAIVHRIVTDHRGTIAVDSAPGRTVFQITLPIDASQ